MWQSRDATLLGEVLDTVDLEDEHHVVELSSPRRRLRPEATFARPALRFAATCAAEDLKAGDLQLLPRLVDLIDATLEPRATGDRGRKGTR